MVTLTWFPSRKNTISATALLVIEIRTAERELETTSGPRMVQR